MSKRVMFKSMIVAVLTVGATFATCAQSAIPAVFPGGQQNRQQQRPSNSAKSAPSRKQSAKADAKKKASSGGKRQEHHQQQPSKAPQDAVVTVMGKGETKEKAKLDAFRAAVEKAVGVWVDAESLLENSELLKDRVNTISNADIKKYEMIKEWRFKSGQFGCKIKAWVEKKAIAPKFASVFPAAFADVGEAAQTIHVQKVTEAKRSGDAASLMTAELEGVDRMRNWVRLSVVKGKALKEVKKIKCWNDRYLNGPVLDVAEVPGKGLYSVRYSMKIDENAYFKGFLPHFKDVLRKMQEGGAEEDVLLTSAAYSKEGRETDDGGKILMTRMGVLQDIPPDLECFLRSDRTVTIGGTYFINPIVLSGFPGVGNVAYPKGHSWPFNIWVLDKMNKYMTSVRCSAYKVPESALQAYWKNLFEKKDDMSGGIFVKASAKVEVLLLDKDNEEITARIDHVPGELVVNGNTGTDGDNSKDYVSFFIRPLFVSHSWSRGYVYSTEIQRDVYFPLTDAQLEKVQGMKVRFVGGKRK